MEMSQPEAPFPYNTDYFASPEEYLKHINPFNLEGILRDLSRPADAWGNPITPGPWPEIIAAELESRERRVKALWSCSPGMPEAPKYDAERGPESYIAEIREAAAACGSVTPPEWADFKDVADEARGRAEQYASQHAQEFQRIFKDSPENVAQGMKFVAANLSEVLLAPHVMATISHEEDRIRILRHHVKFLFWRPPRERELRGSELDSAETALAELPYKAAVPDFFQLDPEHQTAITEALGEECIELCEFINNVDPELLKVPFDRLRAPLIYYSVARLRQTIEQNSSLAAARVCHTFLKYPRRLQIALVEAYEAQERSAVSSIAEGETDYGRNNMKEIERLLADPLVNEDVLDLTMGETVHVTPQDQGVPRKDFEAIVDMHLELLGRAMWGVTPISDKSIHGVRPERWADINIGSVLRDKFAGTLRNLTITRLPVTQEDLSERIGEKYDPHLTPPENIARLILGVEMKSSGKKPAPAFVDMLLIVRKGRPGSPDVFYKNFRGKRTNSMDVALGLHLDAMEVGYTAEVANLQRPFRAGLPSLGRKT